MPKKQLQTDKALAHWNLVGNFIFFGLFMPNANHNAQLNPIISSIDKKDLQLLTLTSVGCAKIKMAAAASNLQYYCSSLQTQA